MSNSDQRRAGNYSEFAATSVVSIRMAIIEMHGISHVLRLSALQVGYEVAKV